MGVTLLQMIWTRKYMTKQNRFQENENMGQKMGQKYNGRDHMGQKCNGRDD